MIDYGNLEKRNCEFIVLSRKAVLQCIFLCAKLKPILNEKETCINYCRGLINTMQIVEFMSTERLSQAEHAAANCMNILEYQLNTTQYVSQGH